MRVTKRMERLGNGRRQGCGKLLASARDDYHLIFKKARDSFPHSSFVPREVLEDNTLENFVESAKDYVVQDRLRSSQLALFLDGKFALFHLYISRKRVGCFDIFVVTSWLWVREGFLWVRSNPLISFCIPILGTS